jgi:RNA polymerase sigma-70 factor (ECF subfamily)
MGLRLVKADVPASDAQLLDGLRAREDWAITLLYRRYARYAASVAYRMLGSEDEVDDVVQSVFLELVRSASRIYGPEYLRSFLLRITTRQVNRRLVRRWRAARLERALALFTPRRSDPRDGAAFDELYEWLGKLSPELRVPWTLHHVEGQTLPETAELCGVSLATAKRRIARADELIGRRFRK